MTELVVNMSEMREKSNLLNLIRVLEGPHRITIVKHRPRRTDRQNRLYWPAYVQPFGDWLRGHGNDHFNDEMAHEVLKNLFLQQSILNPVTGEAMTFTRSTTDLDTAEFTDYLEKVGAFLASECGIENFGRKLGAA